MESVLGADQILYPPQIPGLPPLCLWPPAWTLHWADTHGCTCFNSGPPPPPSGGPASQEAQLGGGGVAWKLLPESLAPQALLFTPRELAACAIFTNLCCYFFCIMSLSKRFTHLLKCHLHREPPRQRGLYKVPSVPSLCSPSDPWPGRHSVSVCHLPHQHTPGVSVPRNLVSRQPYPSSEWEPRE